MKQPFIRANMTIAEGLALFFLVVYVFQISTLTSNKGIQILSLVQPGLLPS